MKRIIIITQDFLDISKKEVSIGGIQTYILELSMVAKTIFDEVIIFQTGSNNSSTFFSGFKVVSFTGKAQQLYNRIYNRQDFFIIATEQLDIKSKVPNSLVIQHGIAFDIPKKFISGFWGKSDFLSHINKFIRCVVNIKRFHQHLNMVCVDYNYYNWLRTLTWIKENQEIRVVPNFSSNFITEQDLEQKLKPRSKPVKIIFARRFEDYRGTSLFINVSIKLLEQFDNIEITFAGDGPLKNSIIEEFQNNQRVFVTSYKSTDSVNFHKDYDISVIPTIFSEGTSLALIEAMAAGCFPIATHVGGLTNIILDTYNGRLAQPNEDSLFRTISETLDLEKNEFNNIVVNAYNTVKTTFSKSFWTKSWKDILVNLSEKQ